MKEMPDAICRDESGCADIYPLFSKEEQMPTGIIIIGPSGSGKTTLGRLVSQMLGFPYFDVDDYIWKKDTEEPYSVMYS